jgi:hypothetical protein
MKKVVFVATLSFLFILTHSQSCLPDGIWFETQNQIDSFQLNFPGCTEIEGEVLITGGYISNLNGLNTITSIGGKLLIASTNLTSISGLENLTHIGGGLFIGDYNENGFCTSGNQLLSDISALINLVSIGDGDNIQLSVCGSPLLTSLHGLDNIDPGTIEQISISYNDLLNNCEIKSICEFLQISYYIGISNNSEGCNSPKEVQDSCEANAVRIYEQFIQDDLILYPNPASKKLGISAKGFTINEASIYTLTGQQVFAIRPENESIEISSLPPGMYIVEVMVEGRKIRRKLLVQR